MRSDGSAAAVDLGLPLDGSLAQRTWDAGYTASPHETIWSRLPFAERAARAIAAGPPGPALELPCGGGANTPVLAAELPIVVAADRSAAALDVANRVSELANCVFLEADVYELPFASRSLAGVFCADLLGHLERPEHALEELARVCLPGARIVVNFFDEEDPSMRDPGMVPVGPRAYLYRDVLFRFDSIETVCELVDQLPVRLLEIETIGWAERPHPGYRDYEHEHRSVLAILEVEPR